MSTQRISACLVVWNGEKVVEDCIKSFKDVVDEIIVIHDGPCRDRTLEICRRYTKKVYVRPFIGEAEPHRPFSFRKAKGDWILWIDQDERLTARLRANIKSLAVDRNADAYTFLWAVKYKNMNLTRGFFSRIRKCVFFRKSKVKNFKGLPNEVLHVTGKTIDTSYAFIHYQEGQRNTFNVFFTKTLRIVSIHADQMIKKGLVKKPAVWYAVKAPLWFFLYLCYYYVLKGAFMTKADRSISFQLALYNFYLYWYIFKRKLA